jgi:sialic acid synthase SpsE
MRGTGLKRPVGPEVMNRINNRKSITAITDIKEGTIITRENIDVKRPGTGVSPQYMEQVIGRRANRDIAIDELVLWSDIE